jgi:hypothetical protein
MLPVPRVRRKRPLYCSRELTESGSWDEAVGYLNGLGLENITETFWLFSQRRESAFNILKEKRFGP